MKKKLSKFLRSPQGQRAVEKAKRQLEKPETQRKLRFALSKLRGRKY